MLGINLWGVIHGLDVFLPRMRKQTGLRHVVNTASLGGLVPLEGHCIYSSSKAAVISLSEAIATELAPHGIGVTILCPGPIPTNLGDSTLRVRGEVSEERRRQFEPVATPTMERIAAFTLSAKPCSRAGCTFIRLPCRPTSWRTGCTSGSERRV
jgi:NAD(P)-dependent dehydrogenase (short-subunit alcohol dehydrogenase family)